MHAHGAITTVGQTVVVLLVLSAGAFGQEPPARDRDVTITITSPNGGEVWTAGTYQTITWTPTGGWPFSAEISLWKSGAFYTYIGTTSSSYGSYDWLVCPLVGDGADYTVHIAITDSPTPAEDDSDAPFEITGSAPVPTLAVTSPNGGESWVAGKTQTITWSSTDPSGYVAAWLYQGGERDLFVGHVPMSAGELTWDVPPYLGDASDYTVRLTWVDECGPAREDFSDGPFAVTDSRPLPTITVTAPNGGEVWTADTVQTITWDSTSPAGDIEIWLNHDESGYEYIGSAPMADGQFVWSLLPCVPVTTDCRIEVRWSDGGRSVADASDAAFELTGATEPVLVVTNPSAGTEWTAGTTQTVTWISSVAHGDVVVELYKGSAFYAVLGRAPAAAGSLTWDICPDIGDGSYTIQLALESCGTYVTGGTFDIVGSVTPTLTLISPTGGETWIAGQSYTIQWTSANLAGYLDIYLPDNTLVQSGHAVVPISAGSFTWAIPPSLTWPPPAPVTQAGGVKIRSYECGPAVSAAGGEFTIVLGTALPGDLDGDNDIDLRDLAGFQAYFTGRGPMFLDPGYDFFDVEPDGDVDMDDWAVIRAGFDGPQAFPRQTRGR
ncbi:MAG: hypothetical protein KA383_01650 [Phycisphaerae bacterium]|nr:hypothetical protein [Phycisphaerae bacterium]